MIVSGLAAEQIRAADEWWRVNRPKAPDAIPEDLDHASSLIAIKPDIGARARNVTLSGVRRVHLARIRYHLYYRLVEEPNAWRFWVYGTRAAQAVRQFDSLPRRAETISSASGWIHSFETNAEA